LIKEGSERDLQAARELLRHLLSLVAPKNGKPRQVRKDAHGPFGNCRLRNFVGRDCGRDRGNDHIKLSRCSTSLLLQRASIYKQHGTHLANQTRIHRRVS